MRERGGCAGGQSISLGVEWNLTDFRRSKVLHLDWKFEKQRIKVGRFTTQGECSPLKLKVVRSLTAEARYRSLVFHQTVIIDKQSDGYLSPAVARSGFHLACT
jgi:hypothetical protein